MKRYPKYKDSGVAWLGWVPEHWPLVRLGSYFELRAEKGSDKDFQPLSVTKSGIVPQLETAAKTDDGDNRKIVRRGDFVINGRSDRKGSSGVSDMDGSVSLINIVLKLRDGLHPRFAHHLFRSSAFQDEFYRWGKGIVADLWSTNYWDFKRIAGAMPPLAEQRIIAEFLEFSLRKIDTAISSQERMIELLKERRSAIITQAVTKGLNPKAKMRDSGVPWLGQVPAHWEVRPLKSLAWSPGTLFIDGDWIESENISDAGIRYLTSGNVGEGLYKEQGAGFITPETFQELNCEEVFPRDVLISRLNLPIGRACVVPDLGQRIVTCVDNVILRTNGSFSPNFLAYLFSSKTHFDNMETLGRGSTMLRISRTTLGNVRFAFPPFNEQLSIVKYLDAVVAELDSTISSQEGMIELLKERRSAIITQAVTGQIDVR